MVASPLLNNPVVVPLPPANCNVPAVTSTLMELKPVVEPVYCIIPLFVRTPPPCIVIVPLDCNVTAFSKVRPTASICNVAPFKAMVVTSVPGLGTPNVNVPVTVTLPTAANVSVPLASPCILAPGVNDRLPSVTF